METTAGAAAAVELEKSPNELIAWPITATK